MTYDRDLYREAQDFKALVEAKLRFPPMWVIYDRPRDHPEHYVIRCWYGTCAEQQFVRAESLDEARDHIDRLGGNIRLDRHPEDDPCIVECWL